MKNRILQLAKGNVIVPKPDISFSEESLEGILYPNRTVSLTLDVVSKNGIPSRLYFESVNPYVKVPKTLSILSTGKITVTISSKGLTFGDTIEGSIEVTWNGGEKEIPFLITVGLTRVDASVPTFSSLDDFLRFANESPEKAKEIFSAREFPDSDFMNDLTYRSAYKTFVSALREDGGLTDFFASLGYSYNFPGMNVGDPTRVRIKKYSDDQLLLQKKYKVTSLLLSAIRFQKANSSLRPIEKETDALYRKYPTDVSVSLLTAYVKYLSKKPEVMKEILLRIQDSVQKDRLKNKEDYCMFLCLVSRLTGDDDRYQSAVNLSERYYAEGTKTEAMVILRYLTGKASAGFLHDAYIYGIKTASVLLFTVYTWEENGSLPGLLSEYELKTALYGIRHHILSEKQFIRLLSSDVRDSRRNELYFQVLKEGYRAFRNPEILYRLVTSMISAKKLSPEDFIWYQDAVNENMTIPGLYEAYLHTSPRNSTARFPLSVLTYFSNHETKGESDQDLLYANVLTYYSEEETVLSLYRERIRVFGLKKADEGVYNPTMLPIYRFILTPENVTKYTAKGMETLLSLKQVRTSLTGVKKLLIHYPELDREDSYPVYSGNMVLAPIFSDKALLAWEGDKPGRYYDPNASVTQIFVNSEVKKLCSLIPNNSLKMNLGISEELLAKEHLTEDEIGTLIRLYKNPGYSPDYRVRLYERLIDISLLKTRKPIDFSDVLSEGEFHSLKRSYRTKLLSSLIVKGHDENALEKIFNYGPVDLSGADLLRVTEKALTDSSLRESPYTVWLCELLLTKETVTGTVLQFLAENRSGTFRNLLNLAKTVHKKKVPCGDFYEKVLITGLFTDCGKEIDSVFDWYTESIQKDEKVVTAYLSYRLDQTVRFGKRLPEKLFNECKARLYKLPRVGLLALIEELSRRTDNCTEEDKELIRRVLEKCIEEDLYLSAFSRFEKVMELPFELKNRVYIEYRDTDLTTTKEVSMTGQCFPESHLFHRILTEVYPGIFVQSFLLYRHEWIQYTLLLYDSHGNITEREGKVIAQETGKKAPGEYTDNLTILETKAHRGDRQETAEFLQELLLKDKMLDEVFNSES